MTKSVPVHDEKFEGMYGFGRGQVTANGIKKKHYHNVPPPSDTSLKKPAPKPLVPASAVLPPKYNVLNDSKVEGYDPALVKDVADQVLSDAINKLGWTTPHKNTKSILEVMRDAFCSACSALLDGLYSDNEADKLQHKRFSVKRMYKTIATVIMQAVILQIRKNLEDTQRYSTMSAEDIMKTCFKEGQNMNDMLTNVKTEILKKNGFLACDAELLVLMYHDLLYIQNNVATFWLVTLWEANMPFNSRTHPYPRGTNTEPPIDSDSGEWGVAWRKKAAKYNPVSSKQAK